MQFFFLVFLSFWTVCAYTKLKQQQKIRFRERLALFEQENWLRLWENLPPILGNSATDLGEIRHRFCGNPSLILWKSVTNFKEIRHRFWGNLSPIFGKSVPDFGEIRHRLLGNPSPILGKTAASFAKLRDKVAPFW